MPCSLPAFLRGTGVFLNAGYCRNHKSEEQSGDQVGRSTDCGDKFEQIEEGTSVALRSTRPVSLWICLAYRKYSTSNPEAEVGKYEEMWTIHFSIINPIGQNIVNTNLESIFDPIG